jgi:BirA family biotin operon repressor/biotin-[acetyl-CoA-carboxylase] ligase
MSSGNIQFRLIHFKQLTSTNIHALAEIDAKNAKEGNLYWTDYQTRGKGQRGSFWKANRAENLLMSLVLEPMIRPEKQFYLSMIAALSVKQLLDTLAVPHTEIKWPNDILIDGEKVAGILIENSIGQNCINATVLGIGINVNQSEFQEFDRKATSLYLKTTKKHRILKLIKNWQAIFDRLYGLLQKNEFEKLRTAYLNSLYGYQIPLKFEDARGHFTAQIIGVEESGKLLLRQGNEVHSYDFKELKFRGKA